MIGQMDAHEGRKQSNAVSTNKRLFVKVRMVARSIMTRRYPEEQIRVSET